MIPEWQQAHLSFSTKSLSAPPFSFFLSLKIYVVIFRFLMSSGLVTELPSTSGSSPADLDAPVSAGDVLDCVKSGGVVDVTKGTEQFNIESSSYPITTHSGSTDSDILVSIPDVAGSPEEICSDNGSDMPCHIDNTPSPRDKYIFKEEALKVKKQKHRMRFSNGFFVGCSVSLVISLGLFIHARNVTDSARHKVYMETVFPLYSLFGFLAVHMIMYASNIYFWKRYRVNYRLIFGFKQGTELDFSQVLFLSFALGSLALLAVLINLVMEMDPKTNDYKAITESLPIFILGLLIAISICPFNICYRSSRFFLLMAVFRCIAAPLYKASLADFFLVDQLTSQVQALRSLEFYICYYGWGDFRLRQNTCKSSDVYNTFYYIVAVIPYWSRFLQCLRRLFEEKDSRQGYNALKFSLTIVAVCLRTAYSLRRGSIWKISAWVFSALATCYSAYWDIVFDWGLLQKPSKNWLRQKLLVPHKAVYYIAMVLNVVLRLAWLQTVLDFNFSFLHRESMVALVAILEIIRRGIWNFFRLENEHLNNVGKFRDEESVPLPFNYEEEEEEERERKRKRRDN